MFLLTFLSATAVAFLGTEVIKTIPRKATVVAETSLKI